MVVRKIVFETPKFGSVLAIEGILTQNWEPKITVVLGKAWKKTAQNGRPYFKMKFDCFRTSSGKALYAKAWSRKAEPNIFDIYAEEKDAPFVNVCPLLGQPSVQHAIGAC